MLPMYTISLSTWLDMQDHGSNEKKVRIIFAPLSY